MKSPLAILYFLHVKRQIWTNVVKLTEHLMLIFISKKLKVLMLTITYLDVSFWGNSILICVVIQIELLLTWLRPSVRRFVRPCTAIERLENR